MCGWPKPFQPPAAATTPQRWGRHAARVLLAAHPDIDAIFRGNDQIATGVADTVRASGRQIPDDVSIVGYDNWRVFAALDGQPVSGVVRQPCRLVVRESTDPLPGDRSAGPVSPTAGDGRTG